MLARILIACILAAGGPCRAQDAGLTGRPVHPLFVWHSSSCERGFIPDAPARAFVRYDGTRVVLASSDENWELLGPSIAHARANCQAVFRSSQSAKDAGRVWIEATYTEDGRIIDALGSRALSDAQDPRCHRTGPGACWLNDIVALRSTDGGSHYTLGPVVAGFRVAFDPDQAERLGFFTASNIVPWHGAFYTVVSWSTGSGATRNCLLRSPTIDDPSSWRAWDGTSFRLDLSAVSPVRPPCVAISPETLSQEVRSISYASKTGRWVAIFADARRQPGGRDVVPGVYASRSADLIHWDTASLLVPLALSKDKSRCNDFVRYPSLLDPGSKSRNFSTLDSAQALLIFTYVHVRHCAGSLDRDLDAIDVPVSTIG